MLYGESVELPLSSSSALGKPSPVCNTAGKLPDLLTGLLGSRNGKEENRHMNTQPHAKLLCVFEIVLLFLLEDDVVGGRCGTRIWYPGTLRMASVSLPVKARRLKRSLSFFLIDI